MPTNCLANSLNFPSLGKEVLDSACLLCSVSHSVCLTLIYFTTTTGLKEEEEASLKVQHWTQTLLVTKTAIAEDEAGKNQPRSTSKGIKTPKSAQESLGETI